MIKCNTEAGSQPHRPHGGGGDGPREHRARAVLWVGTELGREPAKGRRPRRHRADSQRAHRPRCTPKGPNCSAQPSLRRQQQRAPTQRRAAVLPLRDRGPPHPLTGDGVGFTYVHIAARLEVLSLGIRDCLHYTAIPDVPPSPGPWEKHPCPAFRDLTAPGPSCVWSRSVFVLW